MTDARAGGPDVTVLLATNTLNEWVDEAVQSLLTQEGVVLEVVVVHDGIPVDAARAWTDDPRVVCLTTPTSRGLCHALMAGAAVARGQLLSRLDGDDVALPGRLRVQRDYLEARPEVVVVGTRARRIDELGAVTGRLGVTPPGDVRELLLRRNVVIHSSVMMRKKAFDEVGGYAPLQQMEDYDLWLRLARVGEIHVLEDELTDYRVHSAQMSRRAAGAGAYIAAVLRGRQALARHLQRPRSVQHLRNLVWRGAQVARQRGLVRPGYQRAAR